jgi:hypothetical protein
MGILERAVDELVDDIQRDVGLEQCFADILERLADVALADGGLPAEFAEHVGEAFAETVEHGKTTAPGSLGERASAVTAAIDGRGGAAAGEETRARVSPR